MPNIILTELFSNDYRRRAIVSLEDEVILIDYYEDEKYTNTETLPDFTFEKAKDRAEDYVLFQEHQ
jgi:hypothetical protein